MHNKRYIVAPIHALKFKSICKFPNFTTGSGACQDCACVASGLGVPE